MMKNNSRPCPLCGGKKPQNFKVFFDGFVKVYKCCTCGFVAQYPGPGQDTIETNYEDSYSLDFTKKQEFMYPERRAVLQDIVDRIIENSGPGRILDVGCGDGHFLHLCDKKGFECNGLEYSKQLSSYASTKVSGHIHQGKYEKSTYPEGSFDVITFIQVLEHIPDPISVLKIAHYHLRPGGLLVVEVPSVLAPHFLIYGVTKIKWFVTFKGIIKSHVNYFSPGTLSAFADKTNFKKKEVITGRWKYKYSGLLRVVASFTDPMMNATGIGGILYFGVKQ